LMMLACATISARALAVSRTASCCAGSSLRQVEPLRLSSDSQPTDSSQARAAATARPAS
jgi:hypothetical protein